MDRASHGHGTLKISKGDWRSLTLTDSQILQDWTQNICWKQALSHRPAWARTARLRLEPEPNRRVKTGRNRIREVCCGSLISKI